MEPVRPSLNCILKNSKILFIMISLFEHKVYWNISADVIDAQHRSSLNMRIMTE